MNGLTVILAIVILSLAAPFALRIYRSVLVWVTLFIVNVIIISLFIVVRDSAPQKLNPEHRQVSVEQTSVNQVNTDKADSAAKK
jgi:cytoskeletal protein RodZ